MDSDHSLSDEEIILPSLLEQDLYDSIQTKKFEKEKDVELYFLQWTDTHKIIDSIQNKKEHDNPSIDITLDVFCWYSSIIEEIMGTSEDWSVKDIQFLHNTLKNNKFFIGTVQ